MQTFAENPANFAKIAKMISKIFVQFEIFTKRKCDNHLDSFDNSTDANLEKKQITIKEYREA